MSESNISFNLVYRGETLPLKRPSSETLKGFSEYLESLLGVDVSTQKIFLMNKCLTSSEAFKELTLEQLGFQNGVKVYLIGSTAQDIEKVKSFRSDNLLRGFNDNEKQKSKNKKHSNSKRKNNPLIGKLESLPQFHTPSPSKALRLLQRIATDNGIMAIMKKYNWHVGVLKEMPPEGLVGISERCILGYNLNRGEVIALRLRTDDLKGFRNYYRIIETMLHELCHMVYDEHDSKFWEFFRTLKSEYEELDWTKTKGHTLSSESSLHQRDSSESSDEDVEENEPQMLNPHFDANIYWTHTPQELAANAAEKRILKMQQQLQLQLQLQLQQQTQSQTQTKTPSQQHEQQHSSEQIRNNNTFPSQNTFSTTERKVSSLEDNKTQQEYQTSLIQNQHSQFSTLPYWDCPSCTFRNDNSNFFCQMCNHSNPNKHTTPSSITDQISATLTMIDDMKGSVVDTMKDSLSAVGQKIDKKLDTLIQEVNLQDCKIALETLDLILKNILEHPTEQKYRQLYFTNKNFWTKVGRHWPAQEFLSAVGFVKDKERDVLILKWNDLGLLWLAKSAVENKLLTLSK